MHAEFAAGIDQAIDHQELEHLGPGNLFLPLRQALAPEVVQLQLPPQFAAQPAVPEGPGPPENQLVHANLHGVKSIRRHGPIVGEQAHGHRFLPAFADYRKRLAPGRLLRVVDLAEVKHLALEHLAARQPPTLDDAEVAMLLAVLATLACLQVHADDNPAPQRFPQWGWSVLHGF